MAFRAVKIKISGSPSMALTLTKYELHWFKIVQLPHLKN